MVMLYSSNVLFHFESARRHDDSVDAWFAARPDTLGEIAKRWFGVFRSSGDDVRELLHDGCPTACVQTAAFGYVNVFTSHVNVGFFAGSELPDPAGLLEGSGKRMRHVKLRPGGEPDADALRTLIEAAHADMQARLTHA